MGSLSWYIFKARVITDGLKIKGIKIKTEGVMSKSVAVFITDVLERKYGCKPLWFGTVCLEKKRNGYTVYIILDYLRHSNDYKKFGIKLKKIIGRLVKRDIKSQLSVWRPETIATVPIHRITGDHECFDEDGPLFFYTCAWLYDFPEFHKVR